jgi:hypothetical protein
VSPQAFGDARAAERVRHSQGTAALSVPGVRVRAAAEQQVSQVLIAPRRGGVEGRGARRVRGVDVRALGQQALDLIPVALPDSVV